MRIINDKKRGVTAGRSIGKKYKYTVKASNAAKNIKNDKAEIDLELNEISMREEFAQQLIDELEQEYSFKIPDDTWGKIMDLVDDLSFGKYAHENGSTPMVVLEYAIYDIIEEDTGIVID